MLILVADDWCISCEIAIRWMQLDLADVNIRSGDGLVPSGNKPLPEPILTKIYVAKWHH